MSDDLFAIAMTLLILGMQPNINDKKIGVDGWRIGNSTSTIELNGCTEKEKAMVK